VLGSAQGVETRRNWGIARVFTPYPYTWPMNPKKPSVERIECGTITGYKKHHKALETPCRACKDVKNEQSRAYQQKNPEKVIATKAKYRESHREELREKGREYYKKTLEYQKERKAKYRAENKEKERAYRKKRNEENPEIIRQAVRARRARKKQSVSIPYTEKQVLELYGTDCHICTKPIDLKTSRRAGYGEWQFGLHIDHIIPIAHNGPDTLENVQPAHAICNIKRGAPLQP
jgi:hypothetical protein